MNSPWQDLRYGMRVLAKSPGFAAVAVLTLALGIGANTAIFSVVNTVLLRIPYANASRLVEIWTQVALWALSGSDIRISMSQPDIADIKTQGRSFSQIASYTYATMNLTGQGEPEQLSVARVSANFFSVLGVWPEHGRVFFESEMQPGQDREAVLSQDLLRKRFGSDAGVIGKRIQLDDKSYTVVGIMPPGIEYPEKPALWLPLALTDKELQSRENQAYMTVARLKNGVPLSAAQAELKTIATRLAQQDPKDDQGMVLGATLLKERVVGNAERALLLLFGAVGFVLLIACANVANLSLARGWSRQREFAVRAALGASRTRIIRQLLAESVLIAIAGGALGLLVAIWGVDALRSLAPADTPRLSELRVDPVVLWFTAAVSIFAAILFGLLPAMQVSRQDLKSGLKEGSGTGATGAATSRRHRLRDLLVVTEVALSLILLVGSVLLIRSFSHLTSVNLGFRTDHILTLNLNLPESRYAKTPQVAEFRRELLQRIRALPQVQSVAATGTPLLRHMMAIAQYEIEGVPQKASGEGLTLEDRTVTPEFFQALGIQLLKGRLLTQSDSQSGPPVAVVNEELAKTYFPDGKAIGKHLTTRVDSDKHPPIIFEIVGVVANIRDLFPGSKPRATVYTAFVDLGYPEPDRRIDLLVRTAAEPMKVAAAVRDQIWSLDKNQPINQLATMDQVVAESVAEERFRTLLLGVFAGLGLALAVVGIYGVISYSVSQRTHEIGIRVALGAQPGNVFKLVVGQGMRLAISGVVLGLAGAYFATRLLQDLVFEVKTTDPVTYGLMAMLLAAVAVVACYIPARRAMRVDPMVALRYE